MPNIKSSKKAVKVIAKKMLKYLCDNYKQKYNKMLVVTI